MKGALELSQELKETLEAIPRHQETKTGRREILRRRKLCLWCMAPAVGSLCAPCGLKNRERVRAREGWSPAQPGKPGGAGKIY